MASFSSCNNCSAIQYQPRGIRPGRLTVKRQARTLTRFPHSMRVSCGGCLRRSVRVSACSLSVARRRTGHRRLSARSISSPPPMKTSPSSGKSTHTGSMWFGNKRPSTLSPPMCVPITAPMVSTGNSTRIRMCSVSIWMCRSVVCAATQRPFSTRSSPCVHKDNTFWGARGFSELGDWRAQAFGRGGGVCLFKVHENARFSVEQIRL